MSPSVTTCAWEGPTANVRIDRRVRNRRITEDLLGLQTENSFANISLTILSVVRGWDGVVFFYFGEGKCSGDEDREDALSITKGFAVGFCDRENFAAPSAHIT
jgi:hypothetical protein